MFKSIGLFILVIFLTTGCATKRDTGAIVGGVVGGVVGHQFGGGTGKILTTYVGAVAGTIIGSSIGESLDELDRMKLSNTLENTRTNYSSNWTNPDTRSRYNVTPTKTYYSNNTPCREFTMDAYIDGRSQKVNGTACRNNSGNWIMK